MKNEKLDKLNKDLQDYVNEYYKEEIKLVFGSGASNARIVLVGEAPGKHEVLQGKPFVGQAGKNLDEFIDVLGISRDDIYITNAVKLRPYKISPETGRESNRTPTKTEIEFFSEHLKSELNILKPEIVVSLGNIALRSILGSSSATIGVLHGNPLDVDYGEVRFKLFPLYHPASIIYRAELKSVYLEDLHKLKEFLKLNP
ncbi:MAG: uracil-DNA glycosylase [Bacillota bacterium]